MRLFQDLIRNQHFVDGHWKKGELDESLLVVDKFTGKTLAEIALASKDQMEIALEGAKKGFHVLQSWSAGRKSDHLIRLADLLESRAEAFADLIVAEAGKPLGYARLEVDRSLDTLRTAAREAVQFAGEVVPMDYRNGEGRTAYTRRFALGPIAAISPFNFPLNLALHKIAPALAVGCSVVLKPSLLAPLTSLAFAALVQEAGYPAGALNVVLCDNEVAEYLVRHTSIRLVSFTGSPEVGWHIKSIAGAKRVTLELGGNAALIIDENADLTRAAQAAAKGAFLYSGQICISTQRIYVLAAVYQEFMQKLEEATHALKTGDPLLEDTTAGPIISGHHLQRIDAWVKEALSQGATLLSGGKILDAAKNLYAPTLLTHTRPEMKVVCEEVFGPVAIVETVPDFAAALNAVNHSKFGLQAGVFTNRLDHVLLAHQELEVGAVIINQVPGFRIDSMPYGGVKSSGLGREGVRYAMESMTEMRLLVY